MKAEPRNGDDPRQLAAHVEELRAEVEILKLRREALDLQRQVEELRIAPPAPTTPPKLPPGLIWNKRVWY